MTRREKIMALCVGGVLGGFALVKVVQWTVLDPLSNIRQDIAAEQDRARKLNKNLKNLATIEDQWRALTARTLAADPTEAERRFREDVHQLLEVHGLDEPKISAGNPQRYRNGFVGVPISVTARGALKEIVGFLCDFYRAEYLARIDKVSISADTSVITGFNTDAGKRRESKSKSRSGNGAGAEGPELDLSVSAITLVLPPVGGIEPQPLEEVVRSDELARLKGEVMVYNEIVDQNLFKPYVKPPEAVKRPPEPDVAFRPEPLPEPVRPAPPGPKRDNPDKKWLVATTATSGERVAYVINDAAGGETEEYRQDQPIDDGVLLLIHPRGLVVRVDEREGPVDYYYPLRATGAVNFAGRERLDPFEHPEICEAMKQEFVNWDPQPADGAVGMR